MSKKIIYFFVLIVCVENSLICEFNWINLRNYRVDFVGTRAKAHDLLKWTWKNLNTPLPATVISGLVLTYFKKDQEKEKLEKEEIQSLINSRKLHNEAKRKEIELQSRPDWQDAEIKLMAAEAFEKTDQKLVQQRVAEKYLKLRERELILRKQRIEIVNQEMSYLGKLKERMIQVEESLKNESLPEEQRTWLYNELISLNRNYNKINSPISPNIVR